MKIGCLVGTSWLFRIDDSMLPGLITQNIIEPQLKCSTFKKLVIISSIHIKARVHCFSMQVVMNKCLLNPEKKIWRKSVLSFSKKRTFKSEK